MRNEIGWRKCVKGVPQEYEGCDWVLVRTRDICGYESDLPYIAEYSKRTNTWSFREAQESRNPKYYDTMEVLEWKHIDNIPIFLDAVKKAMYDVFQYKEDGNITKYVIDKIIEKL